MSAYDVQSDHVLDALRVLRTYDVAPARAQRLRRRCHAGLRRQSASKTRRPDAGAWRWVMRIFAGAWCVLYLLETIRQAAAVYAH
jgi:hypothetical protein